MRLSGRAKQQVLWIAAASGPVFAVQAVRLLLGTGPAAAGAAQPDVAAEPPASYAAAGPSAPLDDAQHRAIEWIDGGSWRDALARSPMHRPEGARPAPVVVTDGVPKMVVPTLRLGGIVTRGSDAIASINNRLFTVGDEPAQGWRIERIELTMRTVVFRGPDGRIVELSASGVRELPADSE